MNSDELYKKAKHRIEKKHIFAEILEQPRRGDTHAVQVTPHKAKPQCGAKSSVGRSRSANPVKVKVKST